MKKSLIIVLIAVVAVATVGIGAYTNSEIKTFQVIEGSVETINGKPVIRLFSTTWCPHCQWIASTYDSVAKEYADAGKIVAYHWELDTGDNTLTSETETSVPASEQAVFAKFNPRNSIPTFVFGGKYWRIGNGYEQEQDLNLEEKEFRAVIEELIKEAKGQ
jgi:thiol-disulfide isomerase/thioredoxin